MPVIGSFNLRYPQGGAAPDVPGDIQKLAQDVDVALQLAGHVAVTDLDALALLNPSTWESRVVLVDALNANFQASDGSWVQITTARVADTSARDLEYGKASGAYRVLGARVLVTGFTRPIEYEYSGSAWEAITSIFCALNKGTSQTLTTAGTFYPLSWTTEVADPWGMHDNVTNNTRITVPVAGTYEILCHVYANVAAGNMYAQIQVNGSLIIPGVSDRRTAAASVAGQLVIVGPVPLAAGDYIEVMVQNDTQNSVSVAGTTTALTSAVTLKLLRGA